MSIDSKIILGLDLGTNSIGWALIAQNFQEKYGKILGMGSRIIPMSQDILGEYGKGNSISQTAERTRLRSARRLRERHLLRRERLHRVLYTLGYLPAHYAAKIDFDKRKGKFLPETEVKLAYDDNGHFIFKRSFDEMLADFRRYQPQLVADEKMVPYDWTIYYLRKKALAEKIESEELAWLLLHFNQKRGYYQLRGEEGEENEGMNKTEEFYSLSVADVTSDEPQKGKAAIWYNVILENGWIYRRESKFPLFDWKGKTREFIVTTEYDADGNIKKYKDGKEKRSFRSPTENDWKLSKKRTESDIDKSAKTVGEYIYDTLLQQPEQKIKGKLVRTIERKFYKEELGRILRKQIELHDELKDDEIYAKCVAELYPHNLNHRSSLENKDFHHLFVEDILFYQRPLKSQKSTISNCTLEKRWFKKAGVLISEPIKCISKSHPLYQEFRLWQWIANLRVYGKDDDVDRTGEYFSTPEQRAALFGFLNEKKEIELKTLLQFPALKGKKLRWNYVEDKKYPGNETHAMIRERLKKTEGVPEGFLTSEKELELWHIIYSVTDKVDYEKALKTFAAKNSIDIDSFYQAFRRFPPFPGTYGSYSAKAIKRLLPLMRSGQYWDGGGIEVKTIDRIDKILTGEYDEAIQDRVRNKAIHLTAFDHFQGLPEWLAKYIVYNRHAERSDTGKWTSIADLEAYINSFRQHSLKNPIVEQVFTETLRTVKEIWNHYGNGREGFFTEVHIELSRDLKNPKDERKRMTEQISKNENINLRIKLLLAEMMSEGDVENVRPYSPMQQEILKIYEDGVLNSVTEVPDDILKISKMPQPSRSELQRYKLWLEQKYMSPYTGAIIPLNKLFTPAYEIEHIIPQSRYFDDSFSNKLICEAAVNKEKDNRAALKFIKDGSVLLANAGFKLMNEEEYTAFVDRNYGNNRAKKGKLLMLDIPEKMVERQLNDTRYISKYLMQALSNLVRDDKDDDGVNSKNILPGNGKVTARLRNDWGLDAVWNELVLPRFERLNSIMNTSDFTAFNERYQKYLPVVPLEYQKGFQKKRLDHRHHALDALVIACATRSHLNYLSNQHALETKNIKGRNEKDRQDLKNALCDKKYNDGSTENYNWIFKQPWSSFIPDARQSLEKIIVSFKQNLRVINKTVNYHQHVVHNDKVVSKQQKGDHWAIRKPLHKDTVSGLVALQRTKKVALPLALENPKNIVDGKLRKEAQRLLASGYDVKKVALHFKGMGNKVDGKDISKTEVYYFDRDNVASRVSLDTSFNKSKILSITDTGIQKILLRHLDKKMNDAELAFSAEGIEEMNANIVSLNNGKFHQPIYKVRTYEVKGNKFAVGQSGNKVHKYVEAAKGTNLFFAIYQDENGKRDYETVQFNLAVESQKMGHPVVPEINEKGNRLLFSLSPNDLIYVPESDGVSELGVEVGRVYKVVSFTGKRLYGMPVSVATSVVDKVEFSQLNKLEATLDKRSLKEFCYKLSLDRIGNVKSLSK